MFYGRKVPRCLIMFPINPFMFYPPIQYTPIKGVSKKNSKPLNIKNNPKPREKIIEEQQEEQQEEEQQEEQQQEEQQQEEEQQEEEQQEEEQQEEDNEDLKEPILLNGK